MRMEGIYGGVSPGRGAVLDRSAGMTTGGCTSDNSRLTAPPKSNLQHGRYRRSALGL